MFIKNIELNSKLFISFQKSLSRSENCKNLFPTKTTNRKDFNAKINF